MIVKKNILEDKKTYELYFYIQPESRFVAQAVQYSFDILKERGETFSDEETNRITKLIEEKKLKENQETMPRKTWDKNSVEDPNAIELFSQLAIWCFSIIFGVIFGSFILASNFKKLNKSKLSIIVVVFGVFYTVFQVLAIDYLHEIIFFKNSSLTYIFSGVGASILHYLFWKKYIGNEMIYRKKSILLPSIVSILIYIPIIYLMYLSKQLPN